MSLRFSFLTFTFVRRMHLKNVFNFTTNCPHFSFHIQNTGYFFNPSTVFFDTYKNNCLVRLTYIFAKDGKRKCWIYCEYANITGFTEDLVEEDVGHTTPLYNGSRITQVHQPVLYLTTNGIHMLCVYTLLASKCYEPAIILTALCVLPLI